MVADIIAAGAGIVSAVTGVTGILFAVVDRLSAERKMSISLSNHTANDMYGGEVANL